MPGTKSSGRPGGNPELKNYGFKTNRAEPLREKIQLRVSSNMKKELSNQEDWQEFVRIAIAEKLESMKKEEESKAS